MPRPDFDHYALEIAHVVASRSTCDRKHVGAVLVRDRNILATGYNGSLPGQPHCDEAGHDLVRLADGGENCVRTVHAEVNAIAQAARHGTRVAGATLYVNTFPCWPCFKALVAAGVVAVVYDADYRNDPRVETAAAYGGVALTRHRVFADIAPGSRP